MTHHSDTYWQLFLPEAHSTLTTRSDCGTISAVFPRVRCPGITQRSPMGLSPDQNGVLSGVSHRAHFAIHQTALLHLKNLWESSRGFTKATDVGSQLFYPVTPL